MEAWKRIKVSFGSSEGNGIKCNDHKGMKRNGTTTAHPWCDGHSTSISACGVWGVRAGI